MKDNKIVFDHEAEDISEAVKYASGEKVDMRFSDMINTMEAVIDCERISKVAEFIYTHREDPKSLIALAQLVTKGIDPFIEVIHETLGE